MSGQRPIVGMVGAGQLARMCWQAVIGLDVDMRLLAARRDDAAAQVVPQARIGDPADPTALAALAEACDVVTLDHELVDIATLENLEATGHVIRPGGATLRFAQDKAYQRAQFSAAGLPVPAHICVTGERQAAQFAEQHGWPLVLKRPRGGYDGRGVWKVDGPDALSRIWPEVAAGSAVLVEEAVAIACEVAVLLARRPGGQVSVAPLIETVQHDGMLRELVVPARVPAAVQDAAVDLANRVADVVDVVGVCAIELFWTGAELLINEIATRPHNSGHWTIDGASTSQFENHVRAVLDWPLGAMDATGPAVCSVNVVGRDETSWPQAHLARALQTAGVHVHLYGKQPRAGRKIGHVTAISDTIESARTHAHRAARILMSGA